MLRIEDLHVTIGDRKVLKGIDLEIKENETFILFGPNGSGKTTLLMTLMGLGGYEITRGRILFKGQDITRAPIHERARLGLGMSFQRPPTIHGLKMRHLASMAAQGKPLDLEALAGRMHLTDFLDRDVNAGFSGGEIKRSELLQLMAQRPSMLLFDEPESGVDLENMKLIGNTVRDLLGGAPPMDAFCSFRQRKIGRNVSGLIITHTGYILKYVNADRAQVLYEGQLCCESNPREILDHISRYGYQECIRCLQ